MVRPTGGFIHKDDNGRAVIQLPGRMHPYKTFRTGITAFLMQDLKGRLVTLPIPAPTLETLHVIIRNAEIAEREPHDPVRHILSRDEHTVVQEIDALPVERHRFYVLLIYDEGEHFRRDG